MIIIDILAYFLIFSAACLFDFKGSAQNKATSSTECQMCGNEVPFLSAQIKYFKKH